MNQVKQKVGSKKAATNNSIQLCDSGINMSDRIFVELHQNVHMKQRMNKTYEKR